MKVSRVPLFGCFAFALLLGACVLTPPASPLVRDLRQVKPGMTVAQVDAILGSDRTPTSAEAPAPPVSNIPAGVITYPLASLGDASTTQRTYPARRPNGCWEYAIVDFQNGRVSDVHLLN